MKEYFIAIISVVLLCALISQLVPGGYERYVRLLGSLCLVAAMIFPLFSFIEENEISFDGIKDIFSVEGSKKEYYDEYYNNSLLDAEKKNAESILKSEIKRAISTENDAFDVRIVLGESNGEYYISSVEVIIYPSGVSIDPHSVEKYIKESLECECVIIYDF